MMEMPDLMNLIVNNGVAIAVIVYFMFRDFKFMGKLSDSLQELIDITKNFEKRILREEEDKDGTKGRL